MRPNTLKDIKRILYNYSQGKFDRVKTGYLLIKLRYYVDDPIVKDIIHFIAHEQKGWGQSHKLATRFLDTNKEFINSKVSGQPAQLCCLTSIISQEEFLKVINETLNKLGLEFDLHNKDHKFYLSVLENLEDAELLLKESDCKDYYKMKISSIETDQEGRSSLFVSLYPRPVSGPEIEIGDNVQFINIFMQSVPTGKEEERFIGGIRVN